MTRKIRVLFLCTHNSARSQMVEALLCERGGDRFKVYSAGTEATQIHPLAIEAMADIPRTGAAASLVVAGPKRGTRR